MVRSKKRRKGRKPCWSEPQQPTHGVSHHDGNAKMHFPGTLFGSRLVGDCRGGIDLFSPSGTSRSDHLLFMAHCRTT